MKCDDIEILISAYIDGEATEEEIRFVEEHLQGCESCRATLSDFTGLHTLSRELEEVTAPPGFRQRVTERLDAKPRFAFSWRASKLVYALSFSLLVLLSGAVILLHTMWQTPEQVGIEQAALDVDVYAEDILFGQSTVSDSEIYSSSLGTASVAEEILNTIDFGDVDMSFFEESGYSDEIYGIRRV